MRIYDLANSLHKHWNWAGDTYWPLKTGNELPETMLFYPKHGFTHVDAPCHMVVDSLTTDDCALSQLCGEAVLVDVSDCVPARPVTAALLDQRGKGVRKGDIIVLRSNLLQHSPNTSQDYWTHSPYLDASGARWIVERGCVALVIDFPQDYAAREMGDRLVPNEEWTEHLIVLGGRLMHLEHVRNLHAITEQRVFLFGWPVKIPRSDGGPARPVALSQWPPGKPQVFDLSLSLDSGWRNVVRVMRSKSFGAGDPVQETGFAWLGHSHTHVVTPAYVDQAAPGIASLEDAGLANVCGGAVRVDLRDVEDGSLIDEALLSARAEQANSSEILVLHTGFSDRVRYAGLDWLRKAPRLDLRAAEWIVRRGFRAVGFDFELDAAARASNAGLLLEADIPVESCLLRGGAFLIKNLVGLGAIPTPRFFLAAPPLRLQRAESAPARVMAVHWQ
ncbi:MAG: hypothetical protein A3H27_10825 [Acidobacteria bacterium RIFCSPLOWO2_02_FULL_59_13]|nr:MAG: hypothetical protein A3H27_10825 [Acidobacteria bacterium RIFCSPLOWO2_02_FULL_59_13]OGA60802.1 MAG: hypothetical protein A3G81_23785 [Betaproteobacteria bacterium RIFCSPLOWO2_12_FULL_65_14]